MSTFIPRVNWCFPTYSFRRLLILWFAKPAVRVVHAPSTSPLTGLSYLKHHCDPWCFTWCCDSSSFVFLAKGTGRRTPHPAAAIFHVSQATFCTLPNHGPDPTVTEYSLGICSAATQRAQQGSAQLPQSPAGHRGEAGLVPSMASGRALRGLLPQPSQPVFTAPQLLPFSRVPLARCKLPCPHKQTWPGAMCVCGAWQCTNSPCVQDKNLPSEKVWGQREWKYLCKLA